MALLVTGVWLSHKDHIIDGEVIAQSITSGSVGFIWGHTWCPRGDQDVGKSAAASISGLNVVNARFNATMHPFSVIDHSFRPKVQLLRGCVCMCQDTLGLDRSQNNK